MDGLGIDWWDVLSLLIEPDLRQLILIGRLARELNGGCELYASRSSTAGDGAADIDGGETSQARGRHSVHQDDGRGTIAMFSPSWIGRRSARLFRTSSIVNTWCGGDSPAGAGLPGHPVVLLPSAYVNVSRTAVSYAALLPGERFLLVYARNNARLKTLPSNVSTTSLDPYFVHRDTREAAALAQAWELLKVRLMAGAEEYSAAECDWSCSTGFRVCCGGESRCATHGTRFLSRKPSSDACAADDSNPYTRLPLILAANRGIPTLACHHGAMDSKMAVKAPHADIYLAKGEIERDYLLRSCGVPAEKVVLGGQGLPHPAPETAKAAARSSQNPGWCFLPNPFRRQDGALTRCTAISCRNCGHWPRAVDLNSFSRFIPLKASRDIRRIWKISACSRKRGIGVIAGRALAATWRNTRFALTVQSTVALQCASLGIPVFLCSWLRDSSSGYARAVREIWHRTHAGVGRTS